MPIFKKNNRTVYFAHIPKTAGTTVYHLFVQSGWKICNIRKSDDKNSTYTKLKEKYGGSIFLDNTIEDKFLFPLQHVTHKTWKKWGNFDDSFSILRDPKDRFISELKYRYKIKEISKQITYDEFVQKTIRQIATHPWILYRGFAGHLVPQHFFISKTTYLLDFDDNWIDILIKRYDLKKTEANLKVNVSNPNLVTNLNLKTKIFLKLFYYNDYILRKKLKKNKN